MNKEDFDLLSYFLVGVVMPVALLTYIIFQYVEYRREKKKDQ